MQILPVIVVGYSSITVGEGFHLFTATFEDCAGDEYKLNDIKILNEDGTPWDVQSTTETACFITKMTTDGKGAYDSTKMYNYCHYYRAKPTVLDRGLGWYVGAGNTERVTDDITIKNGEGISINNTAGKTIKLQFSGAVTLTGRSCKVGTGYSLVGNLTPVEIKLNEVVILKDDGTPWDVQSTTETACFITKMTTDGKGAYDSTKMYNYCHYYRAKPTVLDRGLGWYVGAGNTERVNDDITIPAGEAVSINNTSGADIIVVFPSPIAPKEVPAE